MQTYSTAHPLLCPYRYEDEINKRTAAENEFVALKKVSGDVSQRKRFKTESGVSGNLTSGPWATQKMSHQP